jgi:hypothetical protein
MITIKRTSADISHFEPSKYQTKKQCRIYRQILQLKKKQSENEQASQGVQAKVEQLLPF